MEELCTACHCTGRKLYFINETGFEALYSQIINEIPIYNLSDLCVRVCWECKALLRKLEAFKSQVKRCYTELLQFVQQNSTKPLPNYPRLQIQHIPSSSFPQVAIKQELDDVDFIDDGIPFHDEVPFQDEVPYHDEIPFQDDDDFVVKSEETHCEPETFVKDLNLDNMKKKRNIKKVVKPIKQKSKRKSKIKNEKEVKKKDIKKTIFDTNLSKSDTIEDIIDSTVEECFNKEENGTAECDKDIEGSTKLETDTNGPLETVTDRPVLKVRRGRVKTVTNGPVKTVAVSEKTKLQEPLPDRPTCAECGKNFSSRKTYRYHLNVLHKGQNRHPCPTCGKVYQWKSNLGRHMRSHRARESGELYCETCDKSFASVATYKQHLKVSRSHVSESEFKFMCNECGKKFVNKTRLRDHIDWEHLKKIKFKCQVCNKPFKCHTSLYVHSQNVHRSKDKKDNLCHVCGKSYQNAAKLKYHIVAMHTSETPYSCAQCAASFGWYSSLYRHVREVHYKMKVQPKKNKKQKKSEVLPPLLPVMAQPLLPPRQTGPPLFK